MASSGTETRIVLCPHCATSNRLPPERLGGDRKSGKCHHALFNGMPVTLTAANFDARTTRADVPILVDYWASWCGPCRQMAPAFVAAARQLEPAMRLGKLNAEAKAGIAARYAIRAIPTMILFRKGREITRQAGAMPEQAITSWTLVAIGNH